MGHRRRTRPRGSGLWMSRFFFVATCAVAVIGFAPGLEAGDESESSPPNKPEERALWRLEWDNDGFVHKDNAFTNGWSL